MRCLVIGGDGFLGSNLALYLIAQGHEVAVTALNRKGETSLDALNVKCRVEYGDVLDPAFCERVINTYEAEWVFHLAAVSIVRIADASPARALRTNIIGTLNVLEACKQKGVKAVVVASSDKAYGDHQGAVYVESSPLLPVGAYEVSKASADMIARLYGRSYGVRTMVTRCANLYGVGDLNWSRLIPGSCKRGVTQGLSPIVHAGSWMHQREWLDVQSACRAYETIAKKGRSGEAYNIGSGKTYRTGELACQIAHQLDVDVPLRIDGEGAFHEIKVQMLESGKIKALGWEPCDEPDRCLHDTVQWYMRYLQGAMVYA